MSIQLNLALAPELASDPEGLKKYAAHYAHLIPEDIRQLRIIRRSVDARKPDIRINLSVEIFTSSDILLPPIARFSPRKVTNKREVIIVGAGPAGLFAGLRLIELGIRPVIVERGKNVTPRKRDIARISRENIVDPDSNYCFGMGGAGTFSDGKLYTRSKKRGDNSRILEILCYHGADESIMYEAHPHLGTDRLPGIIKAIRNSITDAGGTILTEKRVDDFLLDSHSIKGVITNNSEKYLSPFVILATGHSARDIYYICRNKGIEIEAKPFAMGVRVEHPQELIDRIQYHGRPRGKYLPASSYNLVSQIDDRGVYSFCMCPGGFIVPSATSQEEVVVNGMSPSGRNSAYANSGIVVEVRIGDTPYHRHNGPLAGVEYQKMLEREAWEQGGRTQAAPAQRLTDYLEGVVSRTLPSVSYFPGVTSSPLHQWLPESISSRLAGGFKAFGKIMQGFITEEAVILGIESRTSSPVRIPRDNQKMSHIRVNGLYPCGEGSGYAGGIVSSAVDGMKAAEAVFSALTG